jgi:hypothetical protein
LAQSSALKRLRNRVELQVGQDVVSNNDGLDLGRQGKNRAIVLKISHESEGHKSYELATKLVRLAIALLSNQSVELSDADYEESGTSAPAVASGTMATKNQGRGEEFWIEICGRPLPARNTGDGIRAVKGTQQIEPGGLRRYLEGKLGDDLGTVLSAMQRLARIYRPMELAGMAFHLYERFCPAIPEGVRGEGSAR